MKRKRTIKIKRENGQIIMTNDLTELTGFENFKDAREFLKELKENKDNSRIARNFLKGKCRGS